MASARRQVERGWNDMPREGQTVYYARVCIKAGIIEVVPLKVQHVTPNYFTAVDERTNMLIPFFTSQLHNDVFYEKSTASQIVEHKAKMETIRQQNRHQIPKVGQLPGQTDLFDYM